MDGLVFTGRHSFSLSNPLDRRNLNRAMPQLKLNSMRGSAIISLVLLATLWVAAPALACLMPGPAMAEHPCCQQAMKVCGAMNMPQPHTCCQNEPATSDTPAVAQHTSSVGLYVAVEFSSLLKPSELPIASPDSGGPPNASPPGLSVLRI